MKIIILYCLTFLATLPTQAQEQRFGELDTLIDQLYGVISGEAGESRDWDLFVSLFRPEARLIPIRMAEGLYEPSFLSPEEFALQAGSYMEQNGFYEKEIHRVTEQFGNITHIFSTYETYKSKSDSQPFARGINSIQLLFDNNRWWIINIYWQAESEDMKLPQDYLPK